jgi:hypothetical protein
MPVHIIHPYHYSFNESQFWEGVSYLESKKIPKSNTLPTVGIHEADGKVVPELNDTFYCMAK